MADILEFPAREQQAFSFLQEQLSHLLRSKGADQTLIDFAIASLTDAYGELQTKSDCHFEVRLPSQMTKQEASHLQEVLQGLALHPLHAKPTSATTTQMDPPPPRGPAEVWSCGPTCAHIRH